MSANQKEYNRLRTHSSLVARHSALGVNRRYFFQQFGSGLLGAAIGYLWKDDGLLITSCFRNRGWLGRPHRATPADQGEIGDHALHVRRS